MIEDVPGAGSGLCSKLMGSPLHSPRDSKPPCTLWGFAPLHTIPSLSNAHCPTTPHSQNIMPRSSQDTTWGISLPFPQQCTQSFTRQPIDKTVDSLENTTFRSHLAPFHQALSALTSDKLMFLVFAQGTPSLFFKTATSRSSLIVLSRSHRDGLPRVQGKMLLHLVFPHSEEERRCSPSPENTDQTHTPSQVQDGNRASIISSFQAQDWFIALGLHAGYPAHRKYLGFTMGPTIISAGFCPLDFLVLSAHQMPCSRGSTFKNPGNHFYPYLDN